MATFVSVLAIALLCWVLFGTLWRLLVWHRTPARLPIPLTPAPATTAGVLQRLMLELFAFRSLLRASRVTWCASLCFHYGLLWLFVVHLQYLFANMPMWLLPFVNSSGWAAVITFAGLSVLLARRIMVDRVRYVSAPSDFLYLLLLMVLVASGSALKRWWPTDVTAVGRYVQGVFNGDWQSLPASVTLWLHLVLAAVLLFLLPLGKLLHGPGVLFSPTFNQRDPGSSGSSGSGRPGLGPPWIASFGKWPPGK